MLAAFSVAVIGAGAAGVSTVYAESVDESRPFDGIVQVIATRFNLNADEVRKVFEEERAKQLAEREDIKKNKLADRLAQAVVDGKISQAQADAIMNKADELKAFFASLKGKAPQERRDAIKGKMESVKAWAEENDIPRGFIDFAKQFGRQHRGLAR